MGPAPQRPATVNASRIVWLVLDAAGYEVTRRCVEAGVCPSLQRVQAEGFLGPSRPSEPNCQTPAALRALFAGAQPAQSGVWGYEMPDYEGRLARRLSGFAVAPSGPPAIWEELERAGEGYTLLNVALRRDPVWGGGVAHFDLLLDAYREQTFRSARLELSRGRARLKCCRTHLRVQPADQGLRLRRGLRTLAWLPPGRVLPVRVSRRATALFYRAGRHLFAFPSSRPHLRVSPRLEEAAVGLVPERIHHGNLFRFARRNDGALTVEEEMFPSETVTSQMGGLVLGALRSLPSALFVAYFPLVDELSHVYLDRIEREWPQGRAAELLRRCYGLLDSWVGRIMSTLNPGDLLVLSADHGQAPFRRALRLNALLAAAGLVRRTRRGYDLRRSAAYYHPANCGQVVLDRGSAARAGLSRQEVVFRATRCLADANDRLGAELAWLPGDEADPYLLFVYPRGDTHVTGRGDPTDPLVDEEQRGGHHLSPLCPTPWMQAALGLWSPGGLSFDKASIPTDNAALKAFLLEVSGRRRPMRGGA